MQRFIFCALIFSRVTYLSFLFSNISQRVTFRITFLVLTSEYTFILNQLWNQLLALSTVSIIICATSGTVKRKYGFGSAGVVCFLAWQAISMKNLPVYLVNRRSVLHSLISPPRKFPTAIGRECCGICGASNLTKIELLGSVGPSQLSHR